MDCGVSLTIAATKLRHGLYLVPTPLGNVKDITVRALEVLASCDMIYSEDTRVTAQLLRHYGLSKPIRRYDDHADEDQRAAILDQLGGEAVALVSDAGTPLINDPGFKLARDAIAAKHAVHALPGPCAPILALTLSGLATDMFTFAGYLPSKAAAREKACAALAAIRHTVIVFESVHRIAAGLAALADAMGPRPAAVCREMTKLYEEVDRADLETLASRWQEKVAKGEFVIVIGPAPEIAADDGAIDTALAEALAKGARVKEAAAQVSAQFDIPKRDAYQRALALSHDDR